MDLMLKAQVDMIIQQEDPGATFVLSDFKDLINVSKYSYFRMIFNLEAAKILSADCRCYAEDSPDDMILGLCALQENIPVIHNSGFHQVMKDVCRIFSQCPIKIFHRDLGKADRIFPRVSKKKSSPVLP